MFLFTFQQPTSHDLPPSYSARIRDNSTILQVESFHSNANHVPAHQQNESVPVISHI